VCRGREPQSPGKIFSEARYNVTLVYLGKISGEELSARVYISADM